MSQTIWAKVIQIATQDPGGWEKAVEYMFKEMDTDRSGELDLEEIKQGLPGLGIFDFTTMELCAFNHDLDLNSDGSVSLQEFTAAVKIRTKIMYGKADMSDPLVRSREFGWAKLLQGCDEDPVLWRTQVIKMFETFDKNSDGSVDVLELVDGLRRMSVFMSNRQAGFLMEELDLDGDGQITLTEFFMAIRQRQRAMGHVGFTMSDEEFEETSRAAEIAWERMLACIDGAGGQDDNWEEAVQRLYATFDSGQTLSIGIPDLMAGLKTLGVQLDPKQAEVLRNALDKNGDGLISYSEFSEEVRRRRAMAARSADAADQAWFTLLEALEQRELMVENSNRHNGSQTKESRTRQAAAEIFAFFDESGSGEIELNELERGLRKLGVKVTEDQGKALAKDIDAKDEGVISLDCFRKAIELRKTRKPARPSFGVFAGSHSNQTRSDRDSPGTPPVRSKSTDALFRKSTDTFGKKNGEKKRERKST